MQISRRIFHAFVFIFIFANLNLLAQVVWEPPTTIGDPNPATGGGTQTAPTIVCDPAGNAAATWVQEDSAGDKHVFAAFRPAGGFWETAQQLDIGDESHICIDSAGNITVVWTNTAGADYVRSSYRPIGSATWGSNQTIDSATTPTDPNVSCISSGTRAVVIWVDTAGAAQDVVSSFRTGTTWGIVQTVSQTFVADGVSRAIVKMLPNGSAQVAYILTNGASKDVYYNSTTAAAPTTWVPVAQSARGFATDIVRFDFDMNASGNSIIVVRSTTAAQSAVQIGTWGGVIPITLTSAPLDIRVGLDNNGLATAVWLITGPPKAVQVKSVFIAGLTAAQWASPTTVSSATNNLNPRIGVSPYGQIVVIWRENDIADTTLAILGANGVLAPTVYSLDTNTQPDSACINNSAKAFAAWSDLSGFKLVEVTQTIDPTANLAKAANLKRLKFLKTLLP